MIMVCWIVDVLSNPPPAWSRRSAKILESAVPIEMNLFFVQTICWQERSHCWFLRAMLIEVHCISK